MEDLIQQLVTAATASYNDRLAIPNALQLLPSHKVYFSCRIWDAYLFIYKDKSYFFLPIAIAGLILFNPVYPFTFQREIWQQIDKWYAAILLGWAVFEILKGINNVGKN